MKCDNEGSGFLVSPVFNHVLLTRFWARCCFLMHLDGRPSNAQTKQKTREEEELPHTNRKQQLSKPLCFPESFSEPRGVGGVGPVQKVSTKYPLTRHWSNVLKTHPKDEFYFTSAPPHSLPFLTSYWSPGKAPRI